MTRKLLIYLLIFAIFTLLPTVVLAQQSQPQSGDGLSLTGSYITAVGHPKGPRPGAGFQGILHWAAEITNRLQTGQVYGLKNRLIEEVANGIYGTGIWPSTIPPNPQNGAGNLYWCTYLVIDSYNLAGFTGLSRKAGHAAVFNMRNWWRDQGTALGYFYLDYNADRKVLAQVEPGYAMFWLENNNASINNEHVQIVVSKNIDARGDGTIDVLQSNSSAITGHYTVTNWEIPHTDRPVRGFGGMITPAGQPITISPNQPQQPPTGNQTISQIFAGLPGTSSAAFIDADGQLSEKDSNRAQASYSAIKLFIAAAAYNAAQTNFDLSTSYTITAADTTVGGLTVGGSGNLSPSAASHIGESYTYQQYINFMLEYSDNLSTNILINALGGISAANNSIQSMGYTGTSLRRFLGTSQTNPENLTSAHDGVIFMKNLYANQVVDPSSSQQIISILNQRRTLEAPGNQYIRKYLPSGTEYTEKQGNGTHVRNDIGSFVKNGKRYFIAILLSGLTNDDAGADAIGLAAKSLYDLQP